jgi:hypothetical protein
MAAHRLVVSGASTSCRRVEIGSGTRVAEGPTCGLMPVNRVLFDHLTGFSERRKWQRQSSPQIDARQAGWTRRRKSIELIKRKRLCS